MQQLFFCILLLWLQLLFYCVIDVSRLTPVPFPMGVLLMQFPLFNSLCFQTNVSLQFNVDCIYMYFIPYIVIHSVFYQLKKELCSENVLELSYKIVTGFKNILMK